MLRPNDSSQSSNSESAATTSLQPMGFTDILDTIFSLYRNHFRLIVSICSIYVVCRLVANLLIGISAVSAASSNSLNILMLMTVVLSLISYVVMLFVIGGLIFGSAQTFLGKRITASAAFKQAKRRFWSYLGSNLLYVLVVGLLMITCLGIPFALFFGVRWIFCSLAAVFEEKSAVNALRRSSELVKGGWWRVFGITLAILLLAFMIQLILVFSLLIVFGLTQPMGGDGDLVEMFRRMFLPQLTTLGGLVAFMVRNFISDGITSLTLPIGVIGFTLLYFDLRIRKEGFDIEMRVTNEAV